MLVGYMRVSTDGNRQVLDLQRDAIENDRLSFLAGAVMQACRTRGHRRPGPGSTGASVR